MELNTGERALVACYHSLKQTLEEHRDELEPFEERNGIKALACLWQVMNGLDLEPGELYHVGA